MIYVLFAGLLGMIGIAYIFGNRNVLSPWVICCGIFLVSTIFAILNIENWQFSLQPITVLLILAALACLGIGENLITWLYQRQYAHIKTPKQATSLLNEDRQPIYVPFFAVLSLTLLMAVLLLYYYRETYAISLAGGNPGGTELMLKYAREAKLNRLAEISRLYGHVAFLTKSICYVFLYIFIYNFLNFGWKLRWLILLLPAGMYIPFALLNAGRTEFIYLTVLIMVVGCYCYLQNNNWHYRCTFKIFLLAIVALAAFFLVFVLSGFLTGKTSFSTAFHSISFYTGMSIPSLDYWIQNPLPDTPYIGNHTLFPVYSTLRTLGFDVPILYEPYEFVAFNGVSGNVYTAIRRYMEDFTVVGMLSMFTLLGALYSFVLNWLKYRKESGFVLLSLAAFCYPLFEISIEERFFMSVFATKSIYQFVYMGILYYMFVCWPRRVARSSTSMRCRKEKHCCRA